MNQTTQVAIGLGSNKGDRLAYLTAAYARLCTDLLQSPESSSVYETPAWGGVATLPFYNSVAVGFCDWKPPAILSFLKQLEVELGRMPGERYSDREIDLDLLAHGENTWKEEGITVPHPGLVDRQFVLMPFSEVWPRWKHPETGKTAQAMLGDLLLKEPPRFEKCHAPLIA